LSNEGSKASSLAAGFFGTGGNNRSSFGKAGSKRSPLGKGGNKRSSLGISAYFLTKEGSKTSLSGLIPSLNLSYLVSDY